MPAKQHFITAIIIIMLLLLSEPKQKTINLIYYKAQILEHYAKIAMIMLYALIYVQKSDIKRYAFGVANFYTLICSQFICTRCSGSSPKNILKNANMLKIYGKNSFNVFIIMRL